MPLANYFREQMFSKTWDATAQIKIIKKDFIMPGEHAEYLYDKFVFLKKYFQDRTQSGFHNVHGTTATLHFAQR
jgi:hypothetical protein